MPASEMKFRLFGLVWVKQLRLQVIVVVESVLWNLFPHYCF